MKEFISNIPIIGSLTKIIWRLLHINRYVLALQQQQIQIDHLRNEVLIVCNQKIQQMEAEQIASNQKIQQMEAEQIASNQKIQQMEANMATIIERQLFHQVLALHQRIDQFVFDARQTLLRPETTDQDKLSALLGKASILQAKEPRLSLTSLLLL